MNWYPQTLVSICKHYGASPDTPWQRAAGPRCARSSSTARAASRCGSSSRTGCASSRPRSRSRAWSTTCSGAGARPSRAWMREELSRYMSSTTCEACGGYRLKPEALCVKIAGRHIGEVTELVDPRRGRLVRGPAGAAHGQAAGDRRPGVQGDPRAAGLPRQGRASSYLTLARDSGTLSGGESQRIRLASQIGSGLTGVLYVLDEPSIGLHQRDNDRLLETLQQPARPRQHGDRGRARRGRDPLGRPPDRHGAGRRRAWRRDRRRGHARRGRWREPASLTGQYLSGIRAIPVPAKRRKAEEPALARADRLPGQQPAGRRRRASRWAASSASPACRARASRAWWSTRSTRSLARRLMGARAIAGRRTTRSTGHRACRQGGRHRPVADRPHAALQPGHLHRRLHPIRDCSPGCPRPRRAATGRAGSASTSRAAAARPARATG